MEGTQQLLEATHKHGANIRRFVLTSSFAAINNPQKGNWPGHEYSESDWNPETYDQAMTGPDPHVGYRVSKKLAEERAWTFVKEKAPRFDLVTLCPPQMLGPLAQYVSKPVALNTSCSRIHSFIGGTLRTRRSHPQVSFLG
jgi:nucleoside-diphosphate-sugar epimerase